MSGRQQSLNYVVADEFLDEHTNVFMIDLTVYDYLTEHFCWIRIFAEFIKGGGVTTGYSMTNLQLFTPSTIATYVTFLQIMVGLG